jgi:REP element-mobilizing transposase RayT
MKMNNTQTTGLRHHNLGQRPMISRHKPINMEQSLSQMYIHLVFGTKGRRPYFTPAIEKRVHAYMAGTLQQYESPALIINSVPDHVHIIFRLSKNYALARIVEEVSRKKPMVFNPDKG